MTLTDKEKLEAIKKVFDEMSIPIQGFSENVLEAPLIKIREILNS